MTLEEHYYDGTYFGFTAKDKPKDSKEIPLPEIKEHSKQQEQAIRGVDK